MGGMKIYTRSGDKGTTSLVYGVRVAKNDPKVEAYGTCDEANSLIGLSASFLRDASFPEKEKFLAEIRQIQTKLFHVGSELSTPEGKKVHWPIQKEDVENLEKWIDEWDKKLAPLTNFILPGGHPAGAALHSARTIVRRAERCAVALENVNPQVLAYLNRLSDYLFVAARFVNQAFGVKEDVLHSESS